MAVVEMTEVTFCIHSVETWDGVLWLTGCNMHCDMYDACTLPSGNIPLTLLFTAWSCKTCLYRLTVLLTSSLYNVGHIQWRRHLWYNWHS